jgi:hypothetical protein
MSHELHAKTKKKTLRALKYVILMGAERKENEVEIMNVLHVFNFSYLENNC